MAKKDPYEQIMSNIDWNRAILTIIPILQPILIFGLWIFFSKMNKRADAVSKLIAIVEPIPTIDLNVPSPVVLASLYHSLDEALSFWPDSVTDVLGPELTEVLRSEPKDLLGPELTEFLTGLFGK